MSFLKDDLRVSVYIQTHTLMHKHMQAEMHIKDPVMSFKLR